MICKHCSQEIPDDAVRCDKCRKDIDRPWNWLEMSLLIVVTIFIPLVGFAVSAYAVTRAEKKKQGIYLVIFALLNLVISNYLKKYM
jgi:hypothetical protein